MMKPLTIALFTLLLSVAVQAFELPSDLSSLHNLNLACQSIHAPPKGFIELLQNNPELANWANHHIAGSAWNLVFLHELKSYHRLYRRYPEFFQALFRWMSHFSQFNRFPGCRTLIKFLEDRPALGNALVQLMNSGQPGNSFIFQLLANLSALEKCILQAGEPIYVSLVNNLACQVQVIGDTCDALYSQADLHPLLINLTRFLLEHPNRPQLFLNLVTGLQYLLAHHYHFLVAVATNETAIRNLYTMISANPGFAGELANLCQSHVEHDPQRQQYTLPVQSPVPLYRFNLQRLRDVLDAVSLLHYLAVLVMVVIAKGIF